MKTPLKWLRRYVDIDIPLEELCNRMVLSGFEVEEVIDLSKTMENVVTGIVVTMEKHPDADKLVVCGIDVGGDAPLQIVTGASNLFVGAMVPVALHGAKLPNGMQIKKGKLRGVVSEGMLCSGEELCLKEADYPGAEVYGILILHENCPAGTDMRDVLGLNDQVIDFAVTANRPDCQSVIGIAREVAGVLGKELHLPKPAYRTVGGDIKEHISVSVEDTDLCPRYYGRVVRNVRIAESPAWMKECLSASGMRPISNIVDITNFVMLETGQPMHAFDLRDVRGSKIIVRRAKAGETITTLDDKDHTLTPEMLVIADAEGPSCLAGIMGGLDSEIKPDTKDIFFESAKFRRDSVRRTARALGMRTESSARFEKGMDILGVEYAMERALQLIDELDAGDIVDGVIDCNEGLPAPRKLDVPADSVNSLLGLSIPGEEMAQILNRLSIPTTLSDAVLHCEIPSFRDDMEGRADVAEEVMRIYGYDHITGEPMRGAITRGQKSKERLNDDQAKACLIAHGLREMETYAFISAKAPDLLSLDANDPRRMAVPLMNPLSEEYAVLRTQLVSSTLNVLATNYSRKNPSARLFEIARRFIPKALPVTEQPAELPTLSIGLYGDDIDFFVLKGVLEDLFAVFGLTPDYAPYREPYLHPGRSASAEMGGNKLAVFGELHPATAARYGFETRVYVAEVYLDVLYQVADESVTIFKPMPKFPAVERDLALLCDEDLPVATLEKIIRSCGGHRLEKVTLFDVYQGSQIEKGKKSVAYRILLRSQEGTMTEEEVSTVLEKMMRELEKIGAVLRS